MVARPLSAVIFRNDEIFFFFVQSVPTWLYEYIHMNWAIEWWSLGRLIRYYERGKDMEIMYAKISLWPTI